MKKNITITRMGRNEIVKPKYKIVKLTLIFIISAVLLILSGFIFEKYFLRNWYQNCGNEVWISSLASYWGGVLGGIISGGISLIGIIMTIRYYRKNDIINRALDQQPFLKIDVNSKDNFTEEVLFGFGNQTGNKIVINCTIKNIGRGFAQTLTYNNGTTVGGTSYAKTICVGDIVKDFSFAIPNEESEYTFALTFFDEVMNEYAQEYQLTVKTKDNDLPETELISYFPQLLTSNKK